MKKLALVTLAPLALAACGSEKSGTFDDGEGGEGSYTVDQDGDATVATVTNGDGTATLKSGPNVKVQLPEGFTLYPGATVANNTSFGGDGGQGALINMTSTDDPAKLVEFYRKQAGAAGYEITMDARMGDQQAIVGENKAGTKFTFNASPGEGGSQAQLMVAEGL
ncbi:hypothetical protein [Qipengyuania oceanensis]|uniref:Uncharacterized protein n=1 Tax=Qipengyuania oceanensis TaxID=1463597 RepID=A0A844YGK0_9SPHN|nr:hypothetical protein [Qipengyuania oceanensis]MXO62178.1 hypothetical protein [Qipengyuania oceanensis]